MDFSLNWMKEYLDIDESDQQIADKLSLSGSHVESITNLGAKLKNIVVGHIENIEAHPHADRLVVCDVDAGDEKLVIVTGAKNMKTGDYVPVALDGAVLGDGTEIYTTDFRGVTSQGMFCSYQELGFEDSVIPKEYRDGLLIFPEPVKPGTPIQEALFLDRGILELEITPNRPDCLSVIGMTREVQATFKKRMALPSTDVKESSRDISEFFNEVRIETDHCLRYVARVIYDVKVEESPIWLQQRLMQSGMRPINNVVDITNYVMLELGQPLHAFDLETIRPFILVRDANKTASMETLDGTERKLEPSDVLITDGERPLAIAGVMGGLDSEVEPQTTTILLESASFDKDYVRRTSKRLGLRSEASTRFEKGLSPEMCRIVSDRAADLMEELGVGKIARGVIDVYPNPEEEKIVMADPDRVNALLGLSLDPHSMREYLEYLDLFVETKMDGLMVHVPSFRGDLDMEADIAEEVGRLYGFHNIPTKPLQGDLLVGKKTDARRLADRVRQEMLKLNYLEGLSYSFISPKTYDRLALHPNDSARNSVRILNPLGDDFSVMRTTLIGNMLESMRKNQAYKVDAVKLYELGNVFFPKEGDDPVENRRLALGAYGEELDFFSIKSDLEALFDALGVPERRYERLVHPSYHTGRSARIYVGDTEIAVLGEASYDVARAYNLKKRTIIAEIRMEELLVLSREWTKYEPISRFPMMERDIALVVARSMTHGEIAEVIRKASGENLESVHLFDVFTGGSLPVNAKSMAYHLVFRRKDRTLTEEEVDEAMQFILEALREIGAELRK